MSTDDPHADRLAEIFTDANALPSGPQREEYVSAACGDDAVLREKVFRLLAAYQRAGVFMARGPAEPEATRLSEMPGDRIGPYTLLGKLGEGGCGIVYKAAREAPLRRTVALKIIKLGMDTKSVVARFEAERQALALMEHPHIAQVYEAGATESGRPYFAMELVHGVRITDYCTQHCLPAADRLQLFVKVCHAVQHAHQKGVIHRDLKPANVLVTEEDGVPAPKIIDFGIAKAMGPQLTEQTIYTAFEQFIGTPAYMSPEQVAGSAVDIDTRSDIYSLGVLLYELLTGSPPFDQRLMLEAGLDEMRRVIREEEPARPSTRILRRTTASPALSAAAPPDPPPHPSPDLRDTVHRLRGDLDWVILKCLEKDRERRYSSANSLASDIERHLHDEPVLATPPSLSYRLRKLARRHRTAVVAGAFVVFALVAGLIATTWGMVRANRAERDGAKQLCDSMVAQARSVRLSNQSGCRFDGLELLNRARRIAHELQLPTGDLGPMRNAVTAALAVSDLQLGGPWVAFPPDAFACDFDEALAVCAITNPAGDCSIRNVGSDTEICRLPGLGKQALVQLSADGHYAAILHFGDTARTTEALQVWKLDSANPQRLLDEPGAFSCSFRRSELIALGYNDGTIRIHRLSEAKEPRVLPPVTAMPEIRLALHPAEPLIAAASHSTGIIEVRDFESGIVVHSIPVAPIVTCLAWTRAGDRLAAGFSTGGVKFYDRASWEQSDTITPQQTVTSIAFTPDDGAMAVNGWNNVVEIFDTANRQPLLSWPRPQHDPRFSSDGSRLASGIQDGRAGIFKFAAPAAMRLLVQRDPGPDHYYVDVSVHPGGRLAAVATTDGIGFWDLVTGREHVFLPTTPNRNNRALFDSAGNLVTGSRDAVSRWPVSADPAAPGRFNIGPPERLGLPIAVQITQSHDGSVIATSARAVESYLKHAGAWVLRADRGDSPIHLDPGADIFSAVVSPDGKWVVTNAHETAVLKLWDARDGTFIKQLDGRGKAPSFTGDGQWLLTSNRGGQLYSTRTWEPVRSISATLIVPSPDNRLAAMAVEAGIRLVELISGKEVAMLERPNFENLAGMAFSPDGTKLLVRNVSRGIEVWDLRLIRQSLKEMDLDWDWPAFPAATAPSAPFKVHLVDKDARP